MENQYIRLTLPTAHSIISGVYRSETHARYMWLTHVISGLEKQKEEIQNTLNQLRPWKSDLGAKICQGCGGNGWVNYHSDGDSRRMDCDGCKGTGLQLTTKGEDNAQSN